MVCTLEKTVCPSHTWMCRWTCKEGASFLFFDTLEPIVECRRGRTLSMTALAAPMTVAIRVSSCNVASSAAEEII